MAIHKASIPFSHQAAGHQLDSQERPSLLLAEDGLLLKNMQDSIRGARELQFYACLELCRGSTSPWCLEIRERLLEQVSMAQHDPISVFRCSSSLSEALALLHGLEWCCPPCWGPGSIHDAPAIRLQNLCDGYNHPNVIDIKIGRASVYEWATDEYKRKKRAKEAGSWQQVHGFKISGMRTWKNGVVSVLDKKACMARSGNMLDLLASFSGGRVHAVWKPVQDAICKILECQNSTSSPCWHLYSASLLLVYDGMAPEGQDVRVRCSLIDFSHTFFAAGRDSNFVEGMQSLLGMLQSLVTEQDPV